MKHSTTNITTGALIAALYIVLTFVSQAAGLASGVIQVRISEVLTIMPLFTWAAVPGLAVGCLIANIMTGCALWDILFGTIATLIGGLGTYWIGKVMSSEHEHKLGGNCSIVNKRLNLPNEEESEKTSGLLKEEVEKKHGSIKRAIFGVIPPIVSNSLIVPFILQIVYGANGTYLYFVATVGTGEIISCGVLGIILFSSLKGKLHFA